MTKCVSTNTDPLGMEEDPEIQFEGGRSEEYFCPVCLDVLLNPVQFLCCGNHVCSECSKRLLATPNILCPICREEPTGAIEDKHFKRKILSLPVLCYYRKYGCQWKGELRDLPKHVGEEDSKSTKG